MTVLLGFDWSVVDADWSVVDADWSVVDADWSVVDADWFITVMCQKYIPPHQNAHDLQNRLFS